MPEPGTLLLPRQAGSRGWLRRRRRSSQTPASFVLTPVRDVGAGGVSFTDISGTGTGVLAGTDDSSVSAGIGFTFDFYGTGYTTVSVSSNGLMTFGGTTNNAFTNSAMSALTQPSVAVLWDDWQFFQVGTDRVYYQTVGAPGSRQFITQWNVARGFASSPESVTFESVLFEGTNAIEFRYLDANSGDGRSFGGMATVGITGGTGSSNLAWSFNSATIGDGEAIRFEAVPEPGTLLLLGSGLTGLAMRRRRRNS